MQLFRRNRRALVGFCICRRCSTRRNTGSLKKWGATQSPPKVGHDVDVNEPWELHNWSCTEWDAFIKRSVTFLTGFWIFNYFLGDTRLLIVHTRPLCFLQSFYY
ncbi:hypothetical protein AWENTII_000984 [Aspergillus wentii]